MLAARDPIETMLHPYRYAHPVAGAPQSRQRILASAARAIRGLRVRRVTMPANALDFAEILAVGGSRSERRSLELSIDPVSLAVVRAFDPSRDFVGIVHRIHETFAMGLAGRIVAGISGVALTALTLSGLPIALRRMRTRPWTLRHTHGAAGLVSLAFLATLAASGSVIAFAPLLHGDVPAWIRAIHQGTPNAAAWLAIECVAGFTPLFFAITGVAMWGRARRFVIRLAPGPPRAS